MKSNQSGTSSGHDAGGILLRLKRSRRARRMSIRITNEGEVLVTFPLHASPGHVEQFLGSRADWIARTLAKLERDRPDPLTAILTILDCPCSIVVQPAGDCREKVEMEGDRLVVLADRTDPGHVRLLLRSWLRALAERELPPLVAATAARLGFRYRRIQVRDQRTRWGSCSRLGTLSFNWRLVLVPGAVRSYLIIHELCHLRHMNHSTQFWSEVEAQEPEWRAAEQWLRRHGRTVAW